MKRIAAAFVLALLVISLFSCGTKAGAPYFPAVPDKIVVGVKGEEVELLPGDKAFDEVVSALRGREDKAEGFDTLLLLAEDPQTGKHMSYELRESETFVELVYDEVAPQTFHMAQAGGGVANEEIDVQRLFFSLTGEYHECIFIGKDAEYESWATLGSLPDDTDLITCVGDLVMQESASE